MAGVLGLHKVSIHFFLKCTNIKIIRLCLQEYMSRFSWKIGRPGPTFLHDNNQLELSKASRALRFKETLKEQKQSHTTVAHSTRLTTSGATNYDYSVLQVQQTENRERLWLRTQLLHLLTANPLEVNLSFSPADMVVMLLFIFTWCHEDQSKQQQQRIWVLVLSMHNIAGQLVFGV